ncbi:hypothetical protein [Hymenobacter metallilatus]|uniref:Uncharacterized protein n=1 Tax=Hymenobacter metallilatus TaxID=2493666 RepID=A0A3R9U6Z1_9BACT|nr:hypothetical protein [Hymenobacter metallilatus]RSK24203.1 hypothetical protein EI290_20700 [Hymenobacter metallilatus]
MDVSIFKVSRNWCDLSYTPDAYGWLEGHLHTPHGLVSITTLAKPEPDGGGYLDLMMICSGVEYRYRDHKHRTRRSVILLAGRFAKEAVNRSASVSK